MSQKTSFQAIFTPEPEGGFTATVPALPGCISYGEDIIEARSMIADAIVGYLASLAKHGDKIDDSLIQLSSDSFVGVVTV